MLCFLYWGCNTAKTTENSKNYKSDTLLIQKISAHAYQHITYLDTDSFGKVSCNGVIFFDKNEAIVFDTPADNKTSLELINWVENTLHCKIKAIIPTHFHADCLGGLEAFHKRGILSYANNNTIQLAQKDNAMVPQKGFEHLLQLQVGNKKVIAAFIGEGHTKDNIIGYLPDEKIIFGGCLIKEIGAGKGNLADANTTDWPLTVTRLKEKYPDTKIVIPGHGKSGGTELFDYTIKLFALK